MSNLTTEANQDHLLNGYRKFILNNMPRVISQLDRGCDSGTYGCFDRNYWQFKIRDFPSAILQQSCLTLALVYLNQFEGNIYFGNERVRDWCIAALKFWRKIQLKDGSYNEYYPNEHGFPPTAFSLYATAETYRLLGLQDDTLVEAMLKSSKYLSDVWESQALNQEIASITALYCTYLITKRKELLGAIDRKLNAVLDKQSDEGWFPEYGGADLGYLSVSLDFLAEYYYLSSDERVLEPLNRIVDFVQYFVHPNATIGGDYGSRNTEYFLPNGLEILAALNNDTASVILYKLNKQIGNPTYFQNSFDDRYITHYVLHSFIRALIHRKQRDLPAYSLPYEFIHKKHFDDAGIFTINNGCYYAVVGLSKGGVVKAYFGDRNLNDYGYRGKLSDGSLITSSWLDHECKVDIKEDSITVSGHFYRIKPQKPSPLKHIILRFVAFLLGRRLIPVLKKKLIFVNKIAPVKFARQIKFEENHITISDEIHADQIIHEIYTADKQSLRHVASSKFFTTDELYDDAQEVYENVKTVRRHRELRDYK